MLKDCEIYVACRGHKRLMNIPTRALMIEAQIIYETTVFGRTLTALIAGGISAH